MNKFYDPSDMDVIQRLSEDGSNMSIPMEIDVNIIVKSEKDAKDISVILSRENISNYNYVDDDTGEISVVASKSFVLNLNSIADFQEKISNILESFDIVIDGWGSAGNNE